MEARKKNRGEKVVSTCRAGKGSIEPLGSTMQLPPFSASAVAQALEWSGFGPAVAVGKDRIKARVTKKGAKVHNLDFDLTIQPDGSIEGFEPVWNYQNQLPPIVRATLSIVSQIYVGFGDHDFFESFIEEHFDSRIFTARSTYLWMLPGAAAEERVRLVLNEFYIREEPVWCQVNQHDYDQPLYEEFWEHIGSMLVDFKANGKLPKGIKPARIDDCIQQCIPCYHVK